jgi:hypothetical protein
MASLHERGQQLEIFTGLKLPKSCQYDFLSSFGTTIVAFMICAVPTVR